MILEAVYLGQKMNQRNKAMIDWRTEIVRNDLNWFLRVSKIFVLQCNKLSLEHILIRMCKEVPI